MQRGNRARRLLSRKVHWVALALVVMGSGALLPSANAQRRGRSNTSRARQNWQRQQQAYRRQQQAYLRQQQAAEKQWRQQQAQAQKQWLQQQAQAKKQWQEKSLADLDALVGLDATQKPKAVALIAAQANGIEAIGKQNLTQRRRRVALETLQTETWQKVEALLTNKQKQKVDEKNVASQVEGLSQVVNLSDAQKKQVTGILRDGVAQFYRVLDEGELSPAQRTARQGEIERAAWDKVDLALTPEQNQILDSNRQQDVLSELAGELKISDEQKVGIEKIFDERLQNNLALRQSNLSARALLTELEKNRAAMWKQVEALLQPEQVKTLTALRGVQASDPRGKVAAVNASSPALAFPTDDPQGETTNLAENPEDGAAEEDTTEENIEPNQAP